MPRYVAALAALLCLGPSRVSAQSGPLPAAEAEAGWLRLFDGESTFGWESEGGALARVEGSSLVLEPGAGAWLRFRAPFADFELHLEFMSQNPIDSGLYFRARTGANPASAGYEVQIGDIDDDGYRMGSLVGLVKSRRGREASGRWNTLDVTAVGSSITVRWNDREVVSHRSFRSPSGFIGLQAPAGGSIWFRDVRLRPLSLNPIFNGRDLTGWRGVEPQNPEHPPAEWTVRDSILHVEKGPGQLETELSWDDFILQLGVRVNSIDPSRHPNSGVFFRGDRDAWWSGYESQIRNEFKSDPRKPVDYGTGGLYGREVARAIVASDGEWFAKTIVASGRDIAIWVNGYLVTCYRDLNPEGSRISEDKARLLRGTISLQAHDPGTNLDFRSISIAPLPRID